MKEFIGVVPVDLVSIDMLKRDLLIFDRLVIPDLNVFIRNEFGYRYSEYQRYLAGELAWLNEKGVVSDPKEVDGYSMTRLDESSANLLTQFLVATISGYDHAESIPPENRHIFKTRFN